MSYQLFYHLLTGQASSNGDAADRVVMSAYMPESLRNRLLRAGRLRHADISGEQFSYTTVEADRQVYHVLTRVHPGQQGIHRVHHLVLTSIEAGSLCRNEARFTPAGVMLCLMEKGFWHQDDETTAQAVGDQPDIDETALPDASQQPVWKRLTGHKRNADMLNRPPHDRRCVMTLPPEVTTRETLLLLHESEWLSKSCGWGHPFAAAADVVDLGSSMRCLVCREGGTVAKESRKHGWSLLEVRQSEHPLNTPVSGYRQPYAYMEEREDLIYPVRPRHLRRRLLRALAVMLVLGILAAWLMTRCYGWLPF